MPYPTQVTPEQIIEQARTLLERDGEAALSLAKLAGALGVKAPSLYRYFSSRADLLRAVNVDTNTRLTAALVEALAADGDDPVLMMAWAYRAFAHANPNAYALVFAPVSEATPDIEALTPLILPVQAIFDTRYGENGLTALRGVWALIHGFVALELAGQIRRGGALDVAFERAISAYIAGCAATFTA